MKKFQRERKKGEREQGETAWDCFVNTFLKKIYLTLRPQETLLNLISWCNSHCVIILAPSIYPVTIFVTQVMQTCIPEHLCAVAKGKLCDWGNKSS